MSNSSTGFTTTTTTPSSPETTTTTAIRDADHMVFPSSSEQLCYVHCTFCDTVLAVSVPCSSLLKTVTVRCGHCSYLLSVNMRALILPHNSNSPSHPPSFFSPPQNILEEIRNSAPSLLMNHHQAMITSNINQQLLPLPDHHDYIPKPPVVNRPPEKRQRVPSAYNRFIKDEIQRIKAGNPDISHREAFSAAAKNWAHFPHIQFGLMPDHHHHHHQQPVKKANMRQQDSGEDHYLMKDGFLAAPANVGVSPY